MDYNELASDEAIDRAKSALESHGFAVVVVENGEQAKAKALELIPEGSEVMTGTSKTSDTIGLTQVLNESGKYDSVRAKFAKMDRVKDGREMRKLGAAPDYTVGSVHAITEDGAVYIASASGSQIPPYAYGADKVVWIASTKKIVPNQEHAYKRIYEHVLPLENERAKIAYGSGSAVTRLLNFYSERPDRITLILVKEDLGF